MRLMSFMLFLLIGFADELMVGRVEIQLERN